MDRTAIDRIRSSTHIDAPLDAVWKAITTPEQIKRWFLGVDTESDWTVGSQLVHTGEYQGKPYVDKGEILEIEPPKRLVHTHWSDVSGKPDAAEYYQIVAWDLAERDGGTELTVTEENLPSEDAATTSEAAWAAALKSLKELLERSRPRSD
ncbi:MAG TPA: SRPBCC domain-containing protein [Candidatus Limnocylindrales bacterium]|nr:SRPBCC domain-containing protein [Candidatus Limnocylindrales bacterium]